MTPCYWRWVRTHLDELCLKTFLLQHHRTVSQSLCSEWIREKILFFSMPCESAGWLEVFFVISEYAYVRTWWPSDLTVFLVQHNRPTSLSLLRRQIWFNIHRWPRFARCYSEVPSSRDWHCTTGVRAVQRHSGLQHWWGCHIHVLCVEINTAWFNSFFSAWKSLHHNTTIY